MRELKKQRGITLLALVITVIIIIILSTVAINFLFGENGLITRAQQAAQMSDIENVREKLEMAKGTAVIDGKGNIDPDHYFDILEEEGIIGDKETDVIDNGNGTYEVTTVEGYIFIITIVTTPEGETDLEIEYSGTADGPRIVSIKAEGTTNSINIEVDARNAEGATYTYKYKLTNEEEWKEAEQSKNNTCIINNLVDGETYDIEVTVETNEGSITRGTSVHLGELPEGTITFETEWVGDGTARVTINTSAEGYQLQYQTNAVEENGWTNIDSGYTISNLTYPSTVYARIFDGKNGSEHASETLEDKTVPSVTVTPNGTTSNSVSVTAVATDAESGMKDSLTYTYSIKVTGTDDNTYTTPSGASNIASNSYTFTGLTQGTNYTVRVQVNGDKADNVGTGTLANQTTSTVGGATGGLTTGNIVASNPTWSNGQASITLTTSTGLQIQYQTNSTTGQWTTISSGGQVTGLNHNDTVYARLTDGNNYGDYASVTIKDGIAPSAPMISITTGTAGNNGYYKSNVTLTITAGNDEQSGANKIRYAVTGAQTIAQTDTSDGTTSTNITISAEGESTITAYTLDKAGNVSAVATQTINKDATAPSTASLAVGTVGEASIAVTARGADSTSGIYSYKFQRSTTSTTSGFTTVATKTSTATSYSYTYSNLTAETTYYLRVVVTDRAGNTKTSTAVAQETNKKLATNVNELEAGDWVRYPSAQGNIDCRVLYDSSSSYGVEIIAMESVEDVTLGNGVGYQENNTTYFNKAMNSYNNAISTLNSAASDYNNSTYSSRARCVGSSPSNPTSDSPGYFTSSYSYMSSYNGKFKNQDTHYETDHNQMGTLGIRDINDTYWLASRIVYSYSNSGNFNVRYVDASGSLVNNSLCRVFSGGYAASNSHTYGLRPVFLLKSNIKVTGGTGEDGSPYTLGT